MAVVVGIVFGCGNFNHQELVCEEAAAHLEKCCPSFDIHRVRCIYPSCDPEARPDIDPVSAKCIRERSCEDLREKGSCTKLPPPVPTGGDFGFEYQPEACR